MKFASKLLIFLSILLIAFYFLSNSLDNFYRNNYVLCGKSNWILSKEKQTFDFAVIGSSRALNNVYVPDMEDLLDLKGINLALSGANYAENYLVLREFLNKGNTLKTIYIQADVYGMDSPNAYSYPFNDYNYIYLLDDDTVADIFKDHTNCLKYYMWKYVPYAKYAEFSNKYSLYKYFKKGYTCSPLEWDAVSGSELLGIEKEGDKVLFKDAKQNYSYRINSSDSLYLDKLISYCLKKNIVVRLFTSPEKSFFIKQQTNRGYIYAVINEICRRHRVPPCYTQWDETFLTAISSSFRDNTHLDSTGAKLFSYELAHQIKKETLHN